MQYIIKYKGIELKRYQHKLQVWCYLLMNGYMWIGRGAGRERYFKDPAIEIVEIENA